MILALIMLTLLDGKPVYVESSAIYIIRGDHTLCTTASTAISVGGKGLCVKETPEQIKGKIEGVK